MAELPGSAAGGWPRNRADGGTDGGTGGGTGGADGWAGPGQRPALVWQLQAPSRVLDTRATTAPAGRNPPSCRPPPGGAARPAVVLVSRKIDREAGAVARLLGQVGVDCLRIDADTVAQAQLLADPGRGTLLVGDCPVRPTVTWVRHFSAQAIAAGPGAAGAFVRESWQALVSQLASVSTRLLPACRPGAVEQLTVAARLGVRVPRTVIASDPALAAGELAAPRLVVKSLAGHFVEAQPGLLTGVFPEVVERAQLSVAWPQPAAPVLVQEYVEHDAELRVYYVRGEVHAFAVTKQSAADLWLAPDRVGASRAGVPPALHAAVAGLARELRLDYAAFDFLLCGQVPVFLEANLDGDWRWLEIMTGTGDVTVAVARMLASLHGECLRAMPGAVGGGPGRLDLLRFLA